MSYKIVDQIKKSHVPATLKKVLEAYVTFGNRDGTSIRPTEAAVAERASASRITISRRTQTLVALGLLVHDLDEKGYWLKYAYGENGVWAYVYHADASKLKDPALIAQWEERQNEISKKRREAGAKNTTTKWAKGISGNPKGQSNLLLLEQSKVLQTPHSKLVCSSPEQFAVAGADQFATRTLPSDPRSADPSDNPSARSRAVDQNPVSELVSEVCSEASPPHTRVAEQDNNNNTTTPSSLDKAHDPFKDHDCGPWISAEDLYHSLFPNKTWTDADIELLIALAKEVGGIRGVTYGAERAKAAWEWNQIHKKGKWKLFSLAELAKALRSPSDRNLLAQMDADQGCPLCTPEEESEPKPLGSPAQELHEQA